jgi:predicted lipoprotein with Yx(FWY)xxD motif
MGIGGPATKNLLRVGSLCIAATTLAAALALAGCGGGNDTTRTVSGNETNEKPSSTVVEQEPPQVEGSAVSTGTPGKVGSVAVNQVGFTLYATSKDKPNSGKTSCYGKCEKTWVPYLTQGKPRVMVNAHESELGTLKRKDGTTQITYGGWPVYTYKPDPAAATGGVGRHSFGGVWYPINRNGEVVH